MADTSPCGGLECVNGRCDVDRLGNAICDCNSGWEGERCDCELTLII